MIGVGEKKTPQPFVVACDIFTYVENLTTDNEIEIVVKTSEPAKADAGATVKAESDPLPLLAKAFEIAVQENGWAMLTALGNALRQLDPGLDSRTYGHSQLNKLLKAYPHLFKLDESVSSARVIATTAKAQVK